MTPQKSPKRLIAGAHAAAAFGHSGALRFSRIKAARELASLKHPAPSPLIRCDARHALRRAGKVTATATATATATSWDRGLDEPSVSGTGFTFAAAQVVGEWWLSSMSVGWSTALRQLLLPAVLLVSVAGCTAQEHMSPAAGSPLAEHQQGRGLARLNPAPTRAYDLEVSVEGAPGPFAQFAAIAQFDVANENECGRINAASGTAGRITSNEAFALERIDDMQFRGTFYLDLLLDDDYYGRGVCRWQPTEFRVSLRASGADGETYFAAGLPWRNVLEGQPRTLYFWKGGYPVSGMPDYPDFGSIDPSRYAAEKQKELFAITLQARER